MHSHRWKKNEKPQQILNDVLSNDNYLFNKELCMAMLSVNNPSNKLKNKLAFF